MPVKVLISAGNVADCTGACELISGIQADNLIADRGYDTNEIVEAATRAGMHAVIPPKKNRKTKRDYDRHVYKIRHLVEKAFLHLKQWRGIATRYAKKSSSFLAIVQIRCLVLWLGIS
jgi:transposase